MNLLDKLNRSAIERPPKSHRTVKQWALAWNLSEPRARELVVKAFGLGFMKRKNYRVCTGTTVRSVAHYYET